jgi:AmmeMemoRadiSam system protein B/AmmeMemoRadiSam system protein A
LREKKKENALHQQGETMRHWFAAGLIILGLGGRLLSVSCFAQTVKEPNVAGWFYPRDKDALGQQIEGLLQKAVPEEFKGDIFCLISPHAGYEFSGQTAAFGYKLIQERDYKTVVILGPSHYYGFNGISVYAKGIFRTPLGDLMIDSDFTQKIINPSSGISFIPEPFEREHSVETQLPFLQKALSGFKIVPIVVGYCDFKTLRNFADGLVKAIGQRKDVLLVASTDLTHSYDYQETEIFDKLNLSYLEKMSAEDLYDKLKEGTAQMCGGLPVVAAMLAAKTLGHNKLKILSYTNSARVTQRKIKGEWTVGYVSAVIDQEKSEEGMLNAEQKKRLLEISRKTIEEYLISGKRLDFKEDDPLLKEIQGAFVSLYSDGELRGCIGNIIGQKPLFETVRDMAIESATADPRFGPLTKDELKDIEIEISVLSPLKKITNIDEFKLGAHGVLVRRGLSQGIFLPQVAAETGWSKEEFLSYLCSHKAGLSSDAWKDPKTELLIFSAQVFSEKEIKK